MVEFSPANSNDVKKSASDDNKCNELQLSEVHVHRGLLSTVDLLTNHDKNNDCVEHNSTCDIVKQRNALPSIDDIDKSGRQSEEHDIEMHTVQEIGNVHIIQEKSRVIKKRKRASWRSNHIRRQRNVKSKLSRAEMPYDELLKLREKERIAQQQRRERIRKCRAKNVQAQRDSLPLPVVKPVIQDEADNDISEEKHSMLTVFDNSDGDAIGQPDIETRHLKGSDDLIVESSSTEMTKYTQINESDQKIQFMKALGLKLSHFVHNHDTVKTHKRADTSNQVETGIDRTSLFQNHATSGKGNTTLDDSHSSIYKENYDKNIDETSQSSIGEDEHQLNSQSECSSETGDSNSASDNRSLYQLKKARRSNLPKEELQRLREKERMAKRRQRARNRVEHGTVTSTALDSDVSTIIEKAAAKGVDNTEMNQFAVDHCAKEEPAKQDTGAEHDESNALLGETLSSNVAHEKTFSENTLEDLQKSAESGRKLISRFCDRSMLSPAELESLRKREREYQRRRRARLRQMKYNSIGHDQQDEDSTMEATQHLPSNHEMKIENAAKKYETRRSNGISCPSQKYLENSSLMFFDYTENSKLGKTSFDQKNIVEKPIQDSLQFRDQISNHSKQEIESLYNFELPPKRVEEHSLSRDSSFKIDREDRSDFIKALYASDYKNIESSQHLREIETAFDLHPKDRSRIERLLKSEWRNTYSRSLSSETNDGYYSGKFYYATSCSNEGSPDMKKDCKEDERLSEKRARECNSQKWRHWKSGLSEDQLQRRRQSNREAQRRRRMRLKMTQMKTTQEFVMKHADTNCNKQQQQHDIIDDREKLYSISKTRLEDMLEKRQRVFLDAQMEKSRSQIIKQEDNQSQNGIKSRGCRIKVTPQRQVIVPSMSYAHGLERNASQRHFVEKMICPSNSAASSVEFFEDSPMTKNQENQNDMQNRPMEEDVSSFYSASSRKRKQFCPRRLLTDPDRISNESMQRIAIAQT